MTEQRHLLVVHYSQSGHTRALVQALLRGARDPAVDAVLVRERDALQATAADVLWCDAIVIAGPENFGYMNGAIKLFFDRIYYACLGQTDGLPWALLVRAGNDGSGARRAIERIVAGLRWRQVQEPLIAAGEFREPWLSQCEELGLTLAAGLEAGLF